MYGGDDWAAWLPDGVRRPLVSDPEAQQEDRAQDAPPAHDGLHLRVPRRFGWIHLGARDFRVLVPQLENLPKQVDLEPVRVQPPLVELDARIGQDR